MLTPRRMTRAVIFVLGMIVLQPLLPAFAQAANPSPSAAARITGSVTVNGKAAANVSVSVALLGGSSLGSWRTDTAGSYDTGYVLIPQQVVVQASTGPAIPARTVTLTAGMTARVDFSAGTTPTATPTAVPTPTPTPKDDANNRYAVVVLDGSSYTASHLYYDVLIGAVVTSPGKAGCSTGINGICYIEPNKKGEVLTIAASYSWPDGRKASASLQATAPGLGRIILNPGKGDYPLTAKVTDNTATKAPLAGASVTERLRGASCVTGTDGTCSLGLYDRGSSVPVDATYAPAGGTAVKGSVTVLTSNHDSNIANITLSPSKDGENSATLKGMVFGKPTGAVSATLKVVQTGYPDKTVQSDALGNYTIDGLAVGGAVLTASYSVCSATYSINLGQGVNTYNPAVGSCNQNELKGRVTISNGRTGSVALDGVVVRVFRHGQTEEVAYGQSVKGTYSIRSSQLTTGSYDVSVWTDASTKGKQLSSVSAVAYTADQGQVKTVNFNVTQTVPITLTGTVTIEGSTAPFPNVSVVVSQGSTKLTATTDSRGKYSFTSSLATGMAQVTFTSPTDSTSQLTRSVSLVAGVNQLNLSLRAVTPANTIKGHVYSVTNGVQRPEPNQTVVVADNSQPGKIVAKATTDTEGTYTISDPALVPGAVFGVKAVASDSTAISGVQNVSFTAATGETKAVDLTLTSAVKDPESVLISVVGRNEVSNTLFSSISNATVSMVPLSGGATYNGVTGKSGQVSFSRPAHGYYKISVSHPDYDPDTNQVYVGEMDYRHQIYLIKKSDSLTCERHPQPTVSNFFFCGETAKKLYTDRPDLWQTIDSTIAGLRAAYPEDNILPLQIIIDSSEVLNAGYSKAACDPYKELNAPYRTRENIGYSTKILEQSTAIQLKAITTHEWGHGKDYRGGQCKKNLSEQDAFLNLYTQGLTFKDRYLKPITDETYTGFGGHPGDNPREGYASSFMVSTIYEPQFQANAQTAGDPVTQLVTNTAGVAKQHP